MYMREYHEDEPAADGTVTPPGYSGSLFVPSLPQDSAPTESPEEAPADCTAPPSPEPPQSVPVGRFGRLQGWADGWMKRLNIKGWFSSDILLLAAATWLICGEQTDDELLLLLLLLFLVR